MESQYLGLPVILWIVVGVLFLLLLLYGILSSVGRGLSYTRVDDPAAQQKIIELEDRIHIKETEDAYKHLGKSEAEKEIKGRPGGLGFIAIVLVVIVSLGLIGYYGLSSWYRTFFNIQEKIAPAGAICFQFDGGEWKQVEYTPNLEGVNCFQPTLPPSQPLVITQEPISAMTATDEPAVINNNTVFGESSKWVLYDGEPAEWASWTRITSYGDPFATGICGGNPVEIPAEYNHVFAVVEDQNIATGAVIVDDRTVVINCADNSEYRLFWLPPTAP